MEIQHNNNWFEYTGNDWFIYNNNLIKQDQVTKFTEVKEAKELLLLISTDSAKDYEKWYNIGQCLHNINVSLMEDWVNFVKLVGTNETDFQLSKMWNNMRLTKSTIATLRWYAYTDNPIEYIKLKNKINQ